MTTKDGELGLAIRSIRGHRSLRQFAQLAGMPFCSISLYENGKRKPSTARLISLLRLADDERVIPIQHELARRGVRLTDLNINSTPFSMDGKS